MMVHVPNLDKLAINRRRALARDLKTRSTELFLRLCMNTIQTTYNVRYIPHHRHRTIEENVMARVGSGHVQHVRQVVELISLPGCLSNSPDIDHTTNATDCSCKTTRTKLASGGSHRYSLPDMLNRRHRNRGRSDERLICRHGYGWQSLEGSRQP